MRRPTAGQLFDLVVFVLGTCATLWFALPWFRRPDGLTAAEVAVLVSVVVVSQFPIELRSRAGSVVIGFEAAALVFLSLVSPVSQATALWLVAMVVAHGIVQRKAWNVRLFNVGCTAASGVVLTLCAELGYRRGGAAELAFVALGCAAYFIFDLFVTAVSLAVMEHTAVTEALPWRTAFLPLAVFVGIDTLGYLAALIHRAYTPWALLLLVVPVITILVAARSLTRARESERRTAALFAIAQASSAVEGPLDVVALLIERLRGLLPSRTVELLARRPANDEIGMLLTEPGDVTRYVVVRQGAGAPVFNEDERLTLQTLVTVASETLERQRLVDEMTHMARFDPLTGLANRALLVDRLTHAIALVRRGRGMVAMLYCDLDGFKGVNDRFGHEAGDQVLVAVAERLSRTLRSADTAARFGGDEFAILAEDLVDGQEAIAVGNRVVAALEQPFVVRDQPVQLGVSVGIAVSIGDVDAEAVLRSADMAMYRAKAFGKNRVEFFDPEMRRQSEHRMRLEDELRAALDERTLALALQPVVDLRTGAVDGFEALLRWTHPSLGYVAPDVLLPVAEQMGLMPRLGRWVLHEAHRQGIALSVAAERQVTMAINVAAEQLQDEQFLSEAVTLAADPRVHLVLELTERALVEQTAADEALRRLHDAGAGIAIDDFGIGYSSISYLHRFDCIDIVKIDRSFVQTLAGDQRTQALVESIVAMADAFDAVVVAEGIEDWDTCSTLRTAGCMLGQGYLFRPAMPLPEAEAFVVPGLVPFARIVSAGR